jgi:hypothetical protein
MLSIIILIESIVKAWEICPAEAIPHQTIMSLRGMASHAMTKQSIHVRKNEIASPAKRGLNDMGIPPLPLQKKTSEFYKNSEVWSG